MDNRGITIRERADDVGRLFGSCQAIFTYVLSMKHTTAKIVSKLLNIEQKQRSFSASRILKKRWLNCITYEGVYFAEHRIVIDKQINTF